MTKNQKAYLFGKPIVQSLIITGSFNLVFLAMLSIWSNNFRRGEDGPTKLGNFTA